MLFNTDHHITTHPSFKNEFDENFFRFQFKWQSDHHDFNFDSRSPWEPPFHVTCKNMIRLNLNAWPI
eukprot:UN00231